MGNFAQQLKMLRIEMNFSLRQLSDLTNISPSALHAYEMGNRNPKREALEALADVFNCDIEYLLGRTDIRNQEANRLGYKTLYEAYRNTQSKTPSALTEGEKMLLELFRQIPEEQQKVFLEMGRVYANSLKKG
jgi:transcriptional regulator with XRE-family HTH domain